MTFQGEYWHLFSLSKNKKEHIGAWNSIETMESANIFYLLL